jgi:hypothetical protein
VVILPPPFSKAPTIPLPPLKLGNKKGKDKKLIPPGKAGLKIGDGRGGAAGQKL